MARHKVLAIGLDGFEVSLAERYMAEGQMPVLADLRKRSGRFLLDEGPARHAGPPGSTWPRGSHRKGQVAGAKWSSIRLPTRRGKMALVSRLGGRKPTFG